MSLNKFDAIYYINLSHRKDRKEHLENQLNRFGVHPSKIKRIDAYHEILNGHLGCAKSHIKALQTASQNRLSNVLILEDDMIFSKENEEVDMYIEQFFTTMENKWDVFFLAANVMEYESTEHEQIKRVTKARCAHAYSVNGHYLEKLKTCFLKSIHEMNEDEIFMDARYKAIDRQWMPLQVKDRWYIGKYPIGHQGKSYSDIDHRVRNRRHQACLD